MLFLVFHNLLYHLISQLCHLFHNLSNRFQGHHWFIKYMSCSCIGTKHPGVLMPCGHRHHNQTSQYHHHHHTRVNQRDREGRRQGNIAWSPAIRDRLPRVTWSQINVSVEARTEQVLVTRTIVQIGQILETKTIKIKWKRVEETHRTKLEKHSLFKVEIFLDWQHE